MSEPSADVAEMLTQADGLLEAALRLLDDARRYDVAAHVDLALHVLRGTRNGTLSPEPDMIA
jgi:hypothetical protein